MRKIVSLLFIMSTAALAQSDDQVIINPIPNGDVVIKTQDGATAKEQVRVDAATDSVTMSGQVRATPLGLETDTANDVNTLPSDLWNNGAGAIRADFGLLYHYGGFGTGWTWNYYRSSGANTYETFGINGSSAVSAIEQESGTLRFRAQDTFTPGAAPPPILMEITESQTQVANDFQTLGLTDMRGTAEIRTSAPILNFRDTGTTDNFQLAADADVFRVKIDTDNNDTYEQDALILSNNSATFNGAADPSLSIRSLDDLEGTGGVENIADLTFVGTRLGLTRAGAKIRARQDGTWSTGDPNLSPTALEFFTQDSNASSSLSTPRMVIDRNGNVGVGQAVPGSRLHINHGSGYGLEIEKTNDFPGMRFTQADQEAWTIELDSAESLLFKQGNTTSVATRGYFDVNGNFFTTNGAVSAVRSGNLPLILDREASDGNLFEMRRDGTTVGEFTLQSSQLQLNAANGDALSFEVSNSSKLLMGLTVVRFPDLPSSGTTNPACIETSGSVGQFGTCSSSIRYKENIRDLELDSEKIFQLRPVNFNWKKNSKEDFGFIAEEVAEIIPELTYNNKDGEVEGVSYKLLSVLMLPELKKQRDEIAALRAELETLKAELNK